MDAYDIILPISLILMGISIFYTSLGRGRGANFFLEQATKNRMRSPLFKDSSYDEVEKGIKALMRVIGFIFLIVGIWSLLELF